MISKNGTPYLSAFIDHRSALEFIFDYSAQSKEEKLHIFQFCFDDIFKDVLRDYEAKFGEYFSIQSVPVCDFLLSRACVLVVVQLDHSREIELNLNK